MRMAKTCPDARFSAFSFCQPETPLCLSLFRRERQFGRLGFFNNAAYRVSWCKLFRQRHASPHLSHLQWRLTIVESLPCSATNRTGSSPRPDLLSHDILVWPHRDDAADIASLSQIACTASPMEFRTMKTTSTMMMTRWLPIASVVPSWTKPKTRTTRVDAMKNANCKCPRHNRDFDERNVTSMRRSVSVHAPITRVSVKASGVFSVVPLTACAGFAK